MVYLAVITVLLIVAATLCEITRVMPKIAIKATAMLLVGVAVVATVHLTIHSGDGYDLLESYTAEVTEILDEYEASNKDEKDFDILKSNIEKINAEHMKERKVYEKHNKHKDITYFRIADDLDEYLQVSDTIVVIPEYVDYRPPVSRICSKTE